MDTAHTAASTAEGPVFSSFTLDHPIRINGEVVHPAGTEIKVRKPGSGELRGLQLQALFQLDVASLEQLGPRITVPILHKQHMAALDPADMMQFGGEVLDFLLPKGARPDSPTG